MDILTLKALNALQFDSFGVREGDDSGWD